MDTDDLTALVTGANRGIGLEAARQLARAGLDVVLTARDPEAGEAAAGELGVRFERLDVSDDESVRDCARRLEHDGVAVDVLVNNAGVLESGAILGVDDDLMRHTLEVNLLGPLRTARAFMPGMLDRGYGRVVNVSSGSGSLTEAAAYSPAYSISKAALNMLTRQLAFAAEGHGDVKVNAMCPGWVRTDMGGGRLPAPRGGRRHAGVAGDPARRRPDERLLQGPATGSLVGRRPGYLRRQAPPKKRDSRPPARLALNSGAPGSGSGSARRLGGVDRQRHPPLRDPGDLGGVHEPQPARRGDHDAVEDVLARVLEHALDPPDLLPVGGVHGGATLEQLV